MGAWRTLKVVAGPLAVRHLAAQGRAAAVTVFALACGVGAALATQLLYGSVIGSHEETLRRFAGRAALQVTNGTSGVAEELADVIARVPGVRAAAPSVEGFVSVAPGTCEAAAGAFEAERLYLYGIDLLADREVRDYDSDAGGVVEDPLVFLASPDSVALTADFARERGIGIGDAVCMRTPSGPAALTVRALLGRQRGPASALDGRLAVVDLSVAQDLLGMAGRVSTIALTTTPAADVETVRRAVGGLVDGHGVVEPPRSRAAAFGRLLTNYRFGLLVAATLAMLVALAFVSGTASFAVAARRRELGLLRVIGLRRGEVAAVVVVETAALAATSAVLGVGLGIALARLLLADFGAGAAVLYGAGGAATLRLDAMSVVASAVMGMVLPLVAIVGPLRRAADVPPLAAIVTAATDGWKAPSYRRSATAGIALAFAAWATWLMRAALPIPVGVAGTAAMVGAAVGAALCVPAIVHRLLALADRHASRRGRGLVLLACRGLHADVRAIAVTCAALFLGLAGGLGVATWIASLDATVRAAFDTAFLNVDAVVSAGDAPYGADAVSMPPSVAAGIAALPGVAFADAVRVETAAFEDGKIQIVASDTTLQRAGRRRFFMVEGDAGAAAAALAAGSGVLVNRTFARRFGRRPGDLLTLGTPSGPLRVRIAGIHLDLTPGDLGIVRLDRGLYRRWWRDDGATAVEVSLRRPEDRAHVIEAIRSAWGRRHALVVLTLAEVRAEYGALLGRLSGLVSPLLCVALASAAIGTVAGRAASILARRRSSAVLRALGMTRRQLAGLFAMESGAIAAVAVGTAIVAGAALGRLQVAILLRGMIGMSVVHAYPHGLAWLGGAVLVVASGGTGWLVGHRTGRAAPCEALRWE